MTIAIELCQNKYTALRERLRTLQLLHPALDEYAIELEACQDNWMAEYGQANPGRGRAQVASIAQEATIEDLQERLHCDSLPSAHAADFFSLEAAIASISHPLPTV